MGVSAEVFAKAQEQLKEAPPPAESTPTPETAEAGWTVAGSTKKAAEELASFGMKGFLKGADFLKGMAAGTVMPFIPEGDTPGAKAVWGMLKPSEDLLTPQAKEATENPKTVVGKFLGPGAEGVGSMASLPIPGASLARQVVAGFGMGEGAEIGKHVLGGVFNYFWGPEGRKSGEATGQILGGGLGSQANITRMNVVGEALRKPVELAKNVVPAYKSARALQEQGDNRKLWEIFADEYGNLRAETRGIISDFTNSQLASAIRRDIHATTNARQFDADAQVAGMEMEVPMKGEDGVVRMVKPWGLGERTAVPEIAVLSRERVPKTFAEGIDVKGWVEARRQAIINAYNRLAGPKPPATEEGALAAGQAFRQITQSKVDALAAEQGEVQSRFPTLDANSQFTLGEKAREIRDARANQSFANATGRYEQAFTAAGDKRIIETGDVLQDAKDILREFYVKIDPRETLSPVISNLIGAIQKEKKAGPSLILPSELAAERAAAEEVAAKSLTMREANDLVKALGNAASNARTAEQFAKFNRAKELQASILDAIGGSKKLSPEAKALFEDARNFWATEHVPRFGEGAGRALGIERGGVMKGRESIISEDVMGKFLADKETGMLDFDRIYGNDATAAGLLNATLQNQFLSKVLQGAKTPDAIEKNWAAFRDEFSPALSRFPSAAEKMEAATVRTMQLQEEQAREISRYKDIMGGPLTSAVGPVQAKAMYQRVLADPLKMDALLKAMPGNKGDAAQKMAKEVWLQAHPLKNGVYDSEAIFNLLNAGGNNPAVKSSMERLFEAAYGKDGGKKHWDVLNAIAGFQAREAMTAPRHMRAGELMSESPVKGLTGQSAASWISAGRAVGSGQAGGTYFTMLGLSRFANARAQAAVENAKLKALYDPPTAEAILEMAATPSTQPLGISTASKIFGKIKLPNGQNLVDRMIDRGFVKKYVTRGAIYGIEQATMGDQ